MFEAGNAPQQIFFRGESLSALIDKRSSTLDERSLITLALPVRAWCLNDSLLYQKNPCLSDLKLSQVASTFAKFNKSSRNVHQKLPPFRPKTLNGFVVLISGKLPKVKIRLLSYLFLSHLPMCCRQMSQERELSHIFLCTISEHETENVSTF